MSRYAHTSRAFELAIDRLAPDDEHGESAGSGAIQPTDVMDGRATGATRAFTMLGRIMDGFGEGHGRIPTKAEQLTNFLHDANSFMKRYAAACGHESARPRLMVGNRFGQCTGRPTESSRAFVRAHRTPTEPSREEFARTAFLRACTSSAWGISSASHCTTTTCEPPNSIGILEAIRAHAAGEAKRHRGCIHPNRTKTNT